VYPRQEVSREFIVACGDRAEMFDRIEKSFDQIAFAVKCEIAVSLNEAVGFGRNDRLDASGLEGQDQSVRVIGFVREKGLRGEGFQQRLCLAQIRGLPRCQGEGDGVAQSIDQGMNLGRQSASGPSDRLILASFFWAPALC
jgi:hypothetical protein